MPTCPGMGCPISGSRQGGGRRHAGACARGAGRLSPGWRSSSTASPSESDGTDKATLAPETVERAANFIRRVVAPSTFRFYRELGLEGDPHARWIAGHILARKLEKITAYQRVEETRPQTGDAGWPLTMSTAIDEHRDLGAGGDDEDASRGTLGGCQE